MPEICELLAAAPVNESCDERYGWYPSSVEDESRKILNKLIEDSFAGKNNMHYLRNLVISLVSLEMMPNKKNRKSKPQDDANDGGDDDEDSEEEDLQLEENNLEESGDESEEEEGGCSSEQELSDDEEYQPGKK